MRGWSAGFTFWEKGCTIPAASWRRRLNVAASASCAAGSMRRSGAHWSALLVLLLGVTRVGDALVLPGGSATKRTRVGGSGLVTRQVAEGVHRVGDRRAVGRDRLAPGGAVLVEPEHLGPVGAGQTRMARLYQR